MGSPLPGMLEDEGAPGRPETGLFIDVDSEISQRDRELLRLLGSSLQDTCTIPGRESEKLCSPETISFNSSHGVLLSR